MAYNLKDGETLLTVEQLASVSANERRATYFPVGTKLDYANAIFVGYKSSKGRQLAKATALMSNRKDPFKGAVEKTIPFTMIMSVPFQKENELEKTEFQKRLNKCQNAGEVLALIREDGHTAIECVEVVEVDVVPYGESAPRKQRYSIWDWA
jgi:hypothetical protein